MFCCCWIIAKHTFLQLIEITFLKLQKLKKKKDGHTSVSGPPRWDTSASGHHYKLSHPASAPLPSQSPVWTTPVSWNSPSQMWRLQGSEPSDTCREAPRQLLHPQALHPACSRTLVPSSTTRLPARPSRVRAAYRLDGSSAPRTGMLGAGRGRPVCIFVEKGHLSTLGLRSCFSCHLQLLSSPC